MSDEMRTATSPTAASTLARWRTWIAAFDQACADDDWTRLAPFLTDDVIYAVTGAPFSCEIRGRDEVIAGFARSIRNFDRHFDERRWYGVGVRAWEPNAVTGRAMGCYVIGDAAPITFSARSLWLFREDLISVMVDVYDTSEADVVSTLEQLATLGLDVDPSYSAA
jgi:hypothetical protein